MQRGVPPSIGETVAQHSFEAALLAMDMAFILREEGFEVDPYKAAAMAVVHDLAEAVVGDIPRWTSVRLRGLKDELELEAVGEMGLDGGFKDLLAEYVAGSSLEANLVKLADHVSTCVQARRYMESGFRVDDIYENTRENAVALVSTCCPVLRSYVLETCGGGSVPRLS